MTLGAASSGNGRPGFGPRQCGKLNQRTLSRSRNHKDYTLREIENKKKDLIYKDRIHTRKHAFLIIRLLVEEQKSPLRILGHRLVFMELGAQSSRMEKPKQEFK